MHELEMAAVAVRLPARYDLVKKGVSAMLRRMIVTLSILTLLASADPWRASRGADFDWTGWRGAARDAWVGDFRPPARWPEQLERVWQVEVGAGYASPVVAAGRVYQHARQREDEVVWCVDLKTGEIYWRESYAAPFTIGAGGERHGKGPKASPAWADGRLFTMSVAGLLTAWNTDSGDPLWRVDYKSRFEKSHPFWGAATSPLVDGNRVVVHFGTDAGGALIALDAKTGDEVWSHGDDPPSYASPIIVEIEGVRQIVELNQRGLVSVDAESGAQLWEFPYPQVNTDQNMVTPAFHRGLILQGGENRGIHAIEPRLSGGAWTVRERWHQKEVALDMSSPVVVGDHLFGFSHYGQGRIFCLDIASGEVLWQGPARTGENVAFLAAPDHIVALVNDGQLQAIAARNDRFEVVSSYRVSSSPTWSPPVLLEGRILVKDAETLTLWSFAP